MPKQLTSKNLKKETLLRLQNNKHYTNKQKRLAALKVAYSDDFRLLTSNINPLINVHYIYPTHYPAQASGRWSTQNPAVTNWPRKCINQSCPRGEHEWRDECWSVRDVLSYEDDEVMVVHDHDNIEGRIHDLILDHKENLQAHAEGYDLHTITCCKMFHMDFPTNLKNPHTSPEDAAWRAKYNWQGKDTRIRVLAKNMNHGWKYTRTSKFVHMIKGIEEFGVSYYELEDLAKEFIQENIDVWNRKIALMDKMAKEKMSRTLYDFRRVLFDTSKDLNDFRRDAGGQLFSHMISGTVSDFNNRTIALMEEKYGEGHRLIHNAHDGDKFVFKKAMLVEMYGEDWMKPFTQDVRKIIERKLSYEGRSLTMTAGVKVYE